MTVSGADRSARAPGDRPGAPLIAAAAGSTGRPYRVVIYGDSPDRHLHPILAAISTRVLRPVVLLGHFDDRRELTQANPQPAPDGTSDDLLDLGHRIDFEELIIATSASPSETVVDQLCPRFCALPVTVSLLKGCAAPPDGHDQPVLAVIRQAPPRPPLQPLRLLIERGLLAVALFAALPLMGLLAVLIRLDSKGPILFRQKRYGYRGRVFELYKFRTMHSALCDPTGREQCFDGDPRVTKLGAALRQSSMDELPQLFNVLKGDMSLIGPRPHPVAMRIEGKLCWELHKEYFARYRVPPGITGWAQVKGLRGPINSAAKLQRRLERDFYYLENRGLWLDLNILIMTLAQMLKIDVTLSAWRTWAAACIARVRYGKRSASKNDLQRPEGEPIGGVGD